VLLQTMNMKSEKLQTSQSLTELVLKESCKSFLANGNFEISAALATYAFFAIIPLLFFVGYLTVDIAALSQTVMTAVDNFIAHLFPRTEKLITRDLYFFVEHKVTFAVVGIAFLLISVMSLTDTLRTAFIRIFRVEVQLPFVRAQLMNMISALVILLLFVFLVLGEVAYLLVSVRFLRGYLFVAETVASLIVAFMCMVVFYLTFLPVKLRRVQLLTASFLTASLLVAMRDTFSLFIGFNPEFGLAFGSLKTLFIMIIWVYYAFLVILFGAEVMVHIGKRDALLLRGLFLGDGAIEKPLSVLMRRFGRIYGAGDTVFNEGETGDSMFYIISGSVRIIRSNQVFRVMQKGEYFGEMSMLLNSPRTATVVVAEAETKLIAISRENFDVILRENPTIVLAILKEMTMRLKLTSESCL
jgi:YihY family inner membrane protein